MAEALRFGIVGMGKMGHIRAKTVRDHSEAVLVCVTDPNPPMAGFDGADVVPDYQAVIDSEVDAVFVCTPNRFIPEIVEAALDAGKHVFCEKPPGRSVQDVERIMDAERRASGLLVKIGFNHRYHYGIMEAKKIVDSGTYGDILWMRGTYGKAEGSGSATDWRNDPALAGGGILLDQGIHMLDLFRHFSGDFVEFKSMCTTAYWDIQFEDNVFALLRDARGRTAMLHSSFTLWKHRFILEICMEDGYAVVDGMPSSTRSYRDEWVRHARKHTGYAVGNPHEETTFCNTDPSWDLELAEFVESIRTGRPLKNGTTEDALKVMRMVFDIYKDDETFEQHRTTILRNHSAESEK